MSCRMLLHILQLIGCVTERAGCGLERFDRTYALHCDGIPGVIRVKRKREQRDIVKKTLLLPDNLEDHRRLKCRCPDGNCPSKVTEEDQFKLRRNI